MSIDAFFLISLVLYFHLRYLILHVCVAQDTQSPSCLKQFLDHHGLSLLWIFMVEISEAKGNSANNVKLQLEVTYFIDLNIKHIF